MVNKFLIILSFICLYSCKDDVDIANTEQSSANNIVLEEKKELEKQEFITFYKKNSLLHKQKNIAGINYTLSFIPQELMAMREVGENVSSKEINAALAHYSDMNYFDFQIDIPGYNDELLKYRVDGKGNYEQRLKYCSFAIQNDLKILLNSKDTIDCGLVHYEREFNLAPRVKFVVAFPKWKENINEITFLFDDNLFNQGYIKLSMNNKNIINAPKLQNL